MGTIFVNDFKSHLDFWSRLRNGTVKNEEKVLKETLLNHEINMYYRVVAAAHMLPSDVWRRWLRWSNTDFQGFELFLKRITKDQIVTLLAHANMYMLGNDKKLMPCYANGMRNKFWKCVEYVVGNPVEDKLEKYTESKAIAHDFFGFGFGFASFSNEEQVQVTNKSVVRDLLRNDKDKGFEVNKEELGIYFIFYRLMRKNALWGKGKVELSRYICPGFWITLFGWLSFLVLSPISLMASVFSSGWQFWAFLGFGAITPLILFAWGLVHILRKTSYDQEFFENISVAVVFFAAALMISFCLIVVFLAESYVITLFAFWGILAFAHKSKSVFRLPVLSKLFLALTPVMIYFDAKKYAKFMEVLVAIYEKALFPVLGLILGISVFVVINLIIKNKEDETLEKRYELFKKMKLVMCVIFAFLVVLIFFASTIKSSGLTLNIDLAVVLFAFMLFLGVAGYSGNEDPYEKQVKEFIASDNSSRSTQRNLNSIFVKPMARNKNLFSWSGHSMDYLNSDVHILLRMFKDYDDVYIRELQNFLENAKSSEAVNYLADKYFTNAGRTFWHSGSEYQTMFSHEIKLEDMAKVWQANGNGTYTVDMYGSITLEKVIKPTKKYQDELEKIKMESEVKENKFLAKLGDISENVAIFFLYIISKVWNFVTYVPVQLYKLWKLFNEKCPKIEDVRVCR